ncbi:MAG: hypothetical protein JXR96_06585 [Deltaproteobacteria bacterium]|nr:hypothetical protein [Deltaproteobacteria bacterium]
MAACGLLWLAIWTWACGQRAAEHGPADSGAPDAADGGPDSPDGQADGRADGQADADRLLEKVSELPFGEIADIALDGSRLYAADYHGLMIYDLSGSEPARLASLASRGEARRLAVRDGLAFIADGRSGLLIVDVSEPASPRLVSTLPVQDEVLSVAVQGDRAAIGCARIPARIYDLRDPRAWVLLGSLPDRASELAFAPDGLLIAEQPSDDPDSALLALYDLRDPRAPALLGSLLLDRPPPDVCHGANPQLSWGLAADGRYAYLADIYYGHVQLIDIRDPARPEHLGCFSAFGEKVHGLQSRDGKLIAAVDDEVLALDVQVSDSTIEASVSERRGPFDSELIQGIACGDGLAVLLGALGRLRWIDISEPGSPVTAGGQVFSTGWVADIALLGPVALVAYTLPCGDECTPELGGLSALALDQGAVQALCDLRFASSYVRDLAIAGQTAYVVGNQGLFILDVSDPARIELLGGLQAEGFMGLAAAIDPPRIYVVTAGQSKDRLLVLDASDPRAVAELSSTELPVQFHGRRPALAASGSLLLAGDALTGLYVLDVSDPRAPVLVGRYEIPTGDLLLDIGVDLPLVFAAAGLGLHVLDYSDPLQPEELLFEDSPGYAQSLGLADGLLCLGDTHDLVLFERRGPY